MLVAAKKEEIKKKNCTNLKTPVWLLCDDLTRFYSQLLTHGVKMKIHIRESFKFTRVLEKHQRIVKISRITDQVQNENE